MRLPSIFRTSIFRLTAFFAIGSAVSSLLLFAFIYWQTAVYEKARITRILTQEAELLANEPDSDLRHLMVTRLAADFHRVTFAALFDGNGRLIAGNLSAAPTGLIPDGLVHSVTVDYNDDQGAALADILAVARRLPDQRLLVIGRSVDELRNLGTIVTRALALGVIPALIFALMFGGFLSLRTQRRITATNQFLDRIMLGHLHERLPVSQTMDEIDRFAVNVNRMLDEIERLVGQIQGAVDGIAHDLRTPLTRMHTRLERTRAERHTADNIDDFVDRALGDLELTIGIITALLRISEIEEGRRRAAFSAVDMVHVVNTVTELYEPIAEERGVRLSVDRGPVPPVRGDYELLIEAVANLVDNAIKFTPSGGNVRVSVSAREEGRVVVRVADTGPGIPVEERAAVLQRFYRSQASRHIQGHGLGLSLVHAIANLHGFAMVISDGNPGAVFDFVCPSMSQKSVA